MPGRRRRGADALRLQPGKLAAPGRRDRGAHEPARGVHRSSEMAELARAAGHRALPRRTRPAGARRRATAVDRIVGTTAGGDALALNICISYGSRAEITRAARLLAEDVAAGRLAPDQIDEEAARPPALHRGVARSRPPDPHVRRAAHLQLPALAARVRRVPRVAGALARLHPRAPLRGHSRLPAARSSVRPRHGLMDANMVRRVAFAAVAIPLALGIVWLGGLAACARGVAGERAGHARVLRPRPRSRASSAARGIGIVTSALLGPLALVASARGPLCGRGVRLPCSYPWWPYLGAALAARPAGAGRWPVARRPSARSRRSR